MERLRVDTRDSVSSEGSSAGGVAPPRRVVGPRDGPGAAAAAPGLRRLRPPRRLRRSGGSETESNPVEGAAISELPSEVEEEWILASATCMEMSDLKKSNASAFCANGNPG